VTAGPGPQIAWLSSDDPPEAFPDIARACREPEGLLAAGGDLSQERLLYAYRHGIFPWYENGQPILWWSPDPRCVLEPDRFHVARRLRRWLKDCPFELRFNTAYREVVEGCAGRRLGQQGTWITRDMAAAYESLHRSGWAHSVEVWSGDKLVGGIYGVAIGKVFFGESMFSRETNASKIAMQCLCRILAQHDFPMLDCQVVSPHLLTLGAAPMARDEFRRRLETACASPDAFTGWPRKVIPASELANG